MMIGSGENENEEDEEEEEEFSPVVYSLLECRRLKEYYIASHESGWAHLVKEPMTGNLRVSALFISDQPYRKVVRIVPFSIPLDNLENELQNIEATTHKDRWRLMDRQLFNLDAIDRHQLTAFNALASFPLRPFLLSSSPIIIQPSLIFFHDFAHLFLFFTPAPPPPPTVPPQQP